ncbi:MAG: CinA family protein [Oscillospiraceae bacterium]|nr:CinA family protein [Oscillospiraceae bacterium]
MMTNLSSDVIKALQGRTLATAESCTGGGIGAALTAVSGSSAVYKGGIISYTNEIKENLLGVPAAMLAQYGAVSEPVARAMAEGARKALQTDIAVSVTGLAGPGGDEYGNPVGTVFIGYADATVSYANEYHFIGDREEVRNQAIQAALQIILEENK